MQATLSTPTRQIFYSHFKDDKAKAKKVTYCQGHVARERWSGDLKVGILTHKFSLLQNLIH